MKSTSEQTTEAREHIIATLPFGLLPTEAFIEESRQLATKDRAIRIGRKGCALLAEMIRRELTDDEIQKIEDALAAQTIDAVIVPDPSTGTCSAPITVSADDASALKTSG